MKCKKIIFITGNRKKYLAAKKYFKNTNLILVRKNLFCPEIQNMDVKKVVSFSVKYMAKKLGKAVIKSDQGFYIDTLNGFPGTYMHDVEKNIGKNGFKKIMNNEKNRNAKFMEAIAYCEPGKEPIVFSSEKKGKLAKNFQGVNGFGIDFLFIPEGEKNTLATFPNKKLVKMYDFNLWPRLIRFLETR